MEEPSGSSPPDDPVRKLEEELQSCHRYYETILNSIPDPICIKDSEHRWVIVNDMFCFMAGEEREYLLGKSDYDVFPKHEADVFWKGDEEVLRTGRENISEETITDSQGVTRHIVTKKTLFTDHLGGKFILAIGRDVSERKKTEEALRENEEFLRLVIDTTPAHIFVKDREGLFLLVNRATAEFHGTTPDRMTGKEQTEFLVVNDSVVDQLDRFLRDDRRVIENQETLYIPEEKLSQPDGKTLWLETVKVPLTLKGRKDYVLGVATDITARKEAEEALREREELLRQSQKMEAIGRLAGGIAHDFNNLLTAIIGYTEILKMKRTMDEETHHWLDEINRSADRAALLTHQLLAFSRRQVLHVKRVDMNQLILETKAMLNRLIGENIELRTDLKARNSYVDADPGQIVQVIVNLVVNARDAMPQGGRITIRTERVRLEEDLEKGEHDFKPGPYLQMTIADTGHGFGSDMKDRIFEPFFTTKEQGKGTGLGLSTVYGIVTQSGGIIRVESEIDRGTTFTVNLPLSLSGRVDSPENRRAAVPRGEAETILLVEDEDMVRTMMSQVLQRYGYRVLIASNAKEALSFVEDSGERIQLLVTDVIMPGMSGTDLARLLLERIPDLKVLYVSGYTDEAISPHGALDDGALFLQKPFTPHILAETVYQVLSGRPSGGQSS